MAQRTQTLRIGEEIIGCQHLREAINLAARLVGMRAEHRLLERALDLVMTGLDGGIKAEGAQRRGTVVQRGEREAAAVAMAREQHSPMQPDGAVW
eukprot:CAMPEP_0179193892 /NCGR_PEP_ID=MMETSP0796-20121207/96360_1 /TAXON_ID=73915 /ORGANISM="Pyrodinium bahamense, Strain pbaha01" /LENGTH=94 /DNA_ID=CAMNT_0020898209 /DNA_START=172 /DNA_END=456 /DNA_ORIENTATION=+